MLRTYALPLLLVSSFLTGPAGAQTPPRPAAPAPATAPPAAPAPAPAPAQQASRCDATCVRANMEKAAQACARPIEAHAPIDYDWITRPFAGIFDEADPSGPNDSVVLYRGDSIRFMSAQKEWIRVVYECGYDVAAQKLVRLNVAPGRVGRPAPQQAANNGAPKIQANALAAAIMKAAKQSQAAKKSHPNRVAFGEPSPVEIQQVH